METRSYIHVSWQRSKESLVDIDHPDPTFVDAIDRDSLLLRAARPVLSSLAAELANEPVCLILTDSHGVVLLRSGGDNALIGALDAVRLAPGFRYSESDVGTNGIGTALEIGGPILINGHEHYTGNLRRFSCAGALVTHPVSGALLGVIDITTKAENTNPLLLSFAKLAARRIQERILEEANELDAALLGGYYSACRHSGGPVIAVGKEVFMMNSIAQQHFDAGDQAALLDQTRETIGRIDPCTLLADLPSGVVARLTYQPTFVGEALAGGIIRVKPQGAPRTSETHGPALPGLAGTSAAWRRISHEVSTAVSRTEWVLLQGEEGAGKLALIVAAHDSVARDHRLAIADASADDLVEQVTADLEGGADIVIRHAHLLSNEQLDDLVELFQRVQDSSVARDPWVALTTYPDDGNPEVGAHLLHFFPRTVSVPPLRHHVEDLPALVRSLLNRAGATDLVLSKPALNQLMRLPWPGNVSHLRQTLHAICRTRRSGIVDMADLPAECRATSRRSLTRLETLERDAIIEALKVHGGDKAAASESLGMSRATIYRRIREYGIVN
ncbi:Fis family transcriptional regulator [Nocardioides immobilis]|uniref:Fis family transcriptional regulator n=1 Tax=Nocardioides immobilis TaxID=2049295 RepID=A0A417XXX9_9ACTN|nr:helix-turn-helix domain-containing protein [Nocardioides immobilis]RHW25017.1 Fis family transcriptional regulator [Nocardioides immobilis]